MVQMQQGTQFDEGLRVAYDQLKVGDKRAGKIIIFQTDGEGITTIAPAIRTYGVTVSRHLLSL